MENLKKLHAIWQTGSDDAAADASNDIMEALPELMARVKRYESALQAIVDNAAIDTDAPLFRAQAAAHARAALEGGA